MQGKGSLKLHFHDSRPGTVTSSSVRRAERRTLLAYQDPIHARCRLQDLEQWCRRIYDVVASFFGLGLEDRAVSFV